VQVIGAIIILILGRIAAAFAIGFALQGSLANFAAGVLILVLRPWVKKEDYWSVRFDLTKKEVFMKRLRWLIISLLICLVSAGVYAEEEKQWADQAELTFVDTGGNTDVTSLAAKNLLKYSFSEDLVGSWKLAALYGKTDGVKTAENYATEFRMDYAYTDQIYLAGIGGWLKDKFAGIDSRYYIGPAIGYKYLTGPKHFVTGEAGLNYVMEEYTDDTDNSYLQGRLFGLYEYAFTKKNRFSQSLEFLYDFSDSDNYNINSETAVISALSDSFSLKASYLVKYDNEPVPATLDDTDTILSVALVVNF
jgi:putative salt-induced outer membrane protein